ncbi:hypothetical protein PQS90_09120 [Pseudomonas sp. BLCC-B13]|uniref:hypothetical protein n=1 Tax=Pseudomonas sp. BLCC-B13 TaxID=3025314 RepID=UPI00234F3253|nr:hypothetical protein [Pseudomonas sp. BLCC-B13]MDC7825309.1 hypothetical protein [Pseudomonas sp. BLCC-B13]
MGDWSDYFEEFPEENPANQAPKRNPLEQARDAIAGKEAGKGAAQAELDQLIRESKQASEAKKKSD